MPCPNCGGPTRPGAKFCGTCGAPLATTTAFAPTFVTYADSGPLADDPFTPLPPPMRPAAAGASPPVAAPAGVDAPPVAAASGGSWLPATVPSYRRKGSRMAMAAAASSEWVVSSRRACACASAAPVTL